MITYHCSCPSTKTKTVDLDMFQICKDVTCSMFFTCPTCLDLVNSGSSSTLIRSEGVNARNMGSKLELLRIVFKRSSCHNNLIEYIVFSYGSR